MFALESYINDFKILPLTTVYFFDDTDDQLDMLHNVILPAVDIHTPLVRAKLPEHMLSGRKTLKVIICNKKGPLVTLGQQKSNKQKLVKPQRC